MEFTEELKAYTAWKPYREAMGLPAEVTEEYRLLAQGEYNRNYVFTHPVSRKPLVLRVNFGSQMHLENQIQYEYDALMLLRHSGRTPVPCYVDGSLRRLSHGVMVMEYLPGHELDYRTELAFAAECLADIHSVRVGEDTHLIRPKEPLKAILNECEEMVRIYMDSELGACKIKRRIRGMLDEGWRRVEKISSEPAYECCINTELNSTNFLIGGEGEENYLIDWEKPLYGDPAQDLGHFLAPTTTFWKTDVILTPEEMRGFLRLYLQKAEPRFNTDGLWERTFTYIPITCLRGITWCAMAWVEYQKPDRPLFNRSTCQKLGAYLSEEFLKKIETMCD